MYCTLVRNGSGSRLECSRPRSLFLMEFYLLGFLLVLLLGDLHSVIRYCLLMLGLAVSGVLLAVAIGWLFFG